ncbi:MAG: PIN domain nuclease [Bacteroidetes bacterium B1(2017)]|nr:MAG: PIN domain nuclease [Bacteroidetes bacterium B1(2017)]
MGIRYLWDTNTAIYYLQQQFPIGAEKFIDDILKFEQPLISAITEIELLCWKTVSESDLIILNQFINDCSVIELEQSIKLRTASIRKATRIKLPDAIIAATAMEYDLTLLTRNVSDFSVVAGLELLNPWEIN